MKARKNELFQNTISRFKWIRAHILLPAVPKLTKRGQPAANSHPAGGGVGRGEGEFVPGRPEH